jgi:hypothetical protein
MPSYLHILRNTLKMNVMDMNLIWFSFSSMSFVQQCPLYIVQGGGIWEILGICEKENRLVIKFYNLILPFILDYLIQYPIVIITNSLTDSFLNW